jgi:hypothetical protein
VILVLADPLAKKDEMRAEVSAQCHLSLGKRKQVCSEIVILTAGGSSVAESHSVIAALVNSDLPSCLWWRTGSPPEGHLFEELGRICDHLIIDSTAVDIRVAERLVRAAALSVGDLTWSRLDSWRAALALFYDAPAYRAELDHLNRISIECSLSRSSIEPLLLAGWLASRLGFRLRRGITNERNPILLAFTADNREIMMSFVAGDSDIPVSAVSLWPESDDPIFTVRRRDGRIESCVLTGGAEIVIGSPASAQRSEAELMVDELYLLGRDPAYEDALAAAVEIESEVSRLRSH